MPDDLTRLLCDPARLGPWLDAQDLEVSLEGGRPLTVERITTGHSNETFLVRRGGSAWILRRPPRVPLAPTAHDMVREARSEERRVGKECERLCRSRWSPDH